MSNTPRQVTVVTSTKNMGVSILLTVLFGPLGMLYSTIVGAIVMLVVSVIVAFVTFGFGVFIVWPICIIWAAIATSNYNKNLTAGSQSN